jgi:hypothetical protein
MSLFVFLTVVIVFSVVAWIILRVGKTCSVRAVPPRVEPLEPRELLSAFFWTGADPRNPTSWNDAGNWEGGKIPEPPSQFATDKTVSIYINGAAPMVKSKIAFDDIKPTFGVPLNPTTLVVSGGATLILGSSITVGGPDAATPFGTLTVQDNGTIDLNGKTLTIANTKTPPTLFSGSVITSSKAGGTLVDSTGTTLILGPDPDNPKLATAPVVINNATCNVAAGATINDLSNIILSNNASITNAGQMNLSATLSINGSLAPANCIINQNKGSITVGPVGIPAPTNPVQATISVPLIMEGAGQGSLPSFSVTGFGSAIIQGGGYSSNSVFISKGGPITFAPSVPGSIYSAYTWQNNTALQAWGPSGSVIVTGHVIASGSGISVDRLVLQPGGIITVSSGSEMSVQTKFDWLGGTISGGGVEVNAPTVNLGANNQQATTLSLTDSASLTLADSTWTDFNSANLIMDGNTSITNWGNLYIFGDGKSSISEGSGPAPVFTNKGTVEKTTGTGQSVIGVLFINQTGATVQVSSGTLKIPKNRLWNAGLMQATPKGTFNYDGFLDDESGGVLWGGGGEEVGDIVNTAGQIYPGQPGMPGQLTLDGTNGTYTQDAGGTLNINIGGTTPGTSYDQFVISSTAALAGTLNVNLINGFTPTVGQSFTIMTFTSSTGNFQTSCEPTADRSPFTDS